MRKSMAGIAASVTLASLLMGAGPAFAGLEGPPYFGWTFVFDKALPIPANPSENALGNTPVRNFRGTTLGHFIRVEMQEGVTPMGIVTLDDVNKTVAVPLERLRFNPEGRGEVLTDLSWQQLMMIPSGVQLSGRWRVYGRPTAVSAVAPPR